MNICLRLLAAACLLLAVAPAVAQSPAESLTTDPVYRKNCAKCHGKTAEGRHFGGPSLVKTKLSDEAVRSVITNGRGGMPKFSGKLNDQEIAVLAQEIKAMSENPSK
jgi:mono/diheme cytochrome c family protein